MQGSNFIPNCSLVEILITPSGGNTPGVTAFTEQSEFIGRRIIGIQSFDATDVTYSAFNANIGVIPPDVAKGAFLSIQRVGDNLRGSEGLYYKNMPLCMLRATGNADTVTPIQSSTYGNVSWFKPFSFQWNQSKITFPTPIAATSPFVIPFMFYYLTEAEYKQYEAMQRK
jgi:hypothetical protein